MNYPFSRRMTAMKPSSIREILKTTENPEVISFAGGLPAPELFPVEDIRVAADRTLREIGPRALQYSITEGVPALRENVAAEMKRRGVPCSSGDILISTGSQQLLDLIGKVLIDPGSVVLMENPSYLAAIQAFQCFEANFIGVPSDDNGIIPDALPELINRHNPRLLYIISNFQNPSGRTLSMDRRQAIYAIAAAAGLLIVEDDPYGRLRYRGNDIPPIKALDEEGVVVYLSTFSKTVAPGFRTGWVVAPAAIRDKLIVAKQAADLHTSSLDQLVLERYLRDFDNASHVERVRAAYGRRYAVMDKSLSEQLPEGWRWTKPEGGMFLWATGPEGINTTKLLYRALERKVAFVPGRDFFPAADSREGDNCLRLNFSNSPPDIIQEGVSRLGKLLRTASNFVESWNR